MLLIMALRKLPGFNIETRRLIDEAEDWLFGLLPLTCSLPDGSLTFVEIILLAKLQRS